MLNRKLARDFFKEIEEVIYDHIGSEGWKCWKSIGRHSADIDIEIEWEYYPDDDSDLENDLDSVRRDYGAEWDWQGSSIGFTLWDHDE